MYASLHSRESSYTIELFDRLNAMDFFDHEALIEPGGLSEGLAQNLSTRKNYLHHLILRSMRNFHSEKSIRAQVKGLLQDAIFLYQKTLYDQSGKLLRKASRLAQKIEYHPLAIEVKIWENRINKKQKGKGRRDRTLKIHQVKEELIRDWQAEIELNTLYDKLFLQAETDAYVRSADKISTLDSMLAPVNDLPQTTFRASHYALMSKAIHAQMTGNYHQAHDHFQELLGWWEAHPAMVNEEGQAYKITISNLLGTCYLTKQFDRFPTLLEKLLTNPSESPHGHLQLMQQYYTYQMLYCINTNSHEEGEKVSNQTWAWWQENRRLISPSREFTLAFNCVIFALIHHKFEQGLQWINALVNQRQTEVRWKAQFFLRVLRIVFHYELNNLDILESLFRSLLRLHKKLRNRPEERRMIRKFELTLQMKPGPKQRKGFCTLLEILESGFAGDQEKTPPGVKEIKFWLHCKCKGLPIQLYAEAYFGGKR